VPLSNSNLSLGQLIGSTGQVPDIIPSSDVADTTASGRSQGEQEIVSEVNTKYTKWRNDRRPLEATWFYNAALIRGLSNTKWNPVLNVLESRKTPAHRSRENINIILPKVKAKLSKFLKSRAIPVVTAASTDHEDILNAKGTTKVLEYTWERLALEEKYEEALLWSMQTGKCFWWFYWNENAVGQVKEPAGVLGKETIHDLPLGDVGVELGTAFEMLVSDPGITRLHQQPEIMRVKVRPTKDVEKMYSLAEGTIKSEVKESELFQYQRQIASLGAKATVGMATENSRSDEKNTHVVVKELFTAPCAAYPNGRYVVVAGDTVVKQPDDLPYGLSNTSSPYPVVEFADTLTAGQFWPTTMVEQLSGVQRLYSRLRNQLDEHSKLQLHPWIFIPKQAQVHPDAFGGEAGQKIPFNFQPGMPHPQQWLVRPEPINGDVYRMLDILRNEADLLSVLSPAAMGQMGSTSGFETNLLQEAADSVHAPDIRRNELALRDAAFKIRRLIKMGYDIPRLITIVGRDNTPEAFEFSNEQIDEHANIIIDTGSALPQQKHARIEAILKLDERQMFGPVGDPARNRKVLKALDMGSSQEDVDLLGVDEDHARLENLAFTRGEQVEDPMPWENHDLEYEIHTALLKSPEIKSWPPEQRSALVRHVILHVKWKNPQNALQLAAVFGMNDVVAEIQQTMMIQQQFAAPPAQTATPQTPPPGGEQQVATQPAAPAQPAPPVA
jgi:hypothetical protein